MSKKPKQKDFGQLTLRQKIAQLMIVRVPINMNDSQKDSFLKLVRQNEVGGVCFFAGVSAAQIELTNNLQKQSAIPLMVCIDGETGVGMRLNDIPSFPSQMLLGAMPSTYDGLIKEMGRVMGQQCSALGVHVNFAPVVDLNTNPKNPVIGRRSFGEDRARVSEKAAKLVEGMQQEGVVAVAKHFPGHGDTENDSHLTLPLENHSKKYIDSVNLYPFKQMIAEQVGGVMIAHLHVPSLTQGEGSKSIPSISSLSRAVVTGLLRGELGYQGLVITDGLDMKAVTNSYSDGEASLLALLAGSDLLLLPDDVGKAIDRIEEAANENDSIKLLIDERCRRVLDAKKSWKMGEKMPKKDASARLKKLNSKVDSLSYQMALHSVTLLRDDNVLTNESYDSIRRFEVTSKSVATMMNEVSEINPGDPLILLVYDTPYTLNKLVPWLDTVNHPLALLMAYENRTTVRRAVDSLLSAAAHYKQCGPVFEGRLPVAAGRYHCGDGLTLKYVPPVKQVVVSTLKHRQPLLCDQIDRIVEHGIAEKAYPGCQLLIAHKGTIVYQRSYGTFTYDSLSPLVSPTNLYDLASLTKVTATTMAMMRLVDEGKVKITDKLSKYLPYLKHTNKSRITIKEVMSHCARLQPGDCLWSGCDLTRDTLPDSTARALQIIANNNLIKEKNKYLYSDLGFILLGDLVKRVTGVPLDKYVDSCFYRPLGMTSTTFNPLLHGFEKDSIVPTEFSKELRGGRLIRGTVHDPNAAAMGGVAGHAGLFSNIGDLAKLYMMMLNDGTDSSGRRYLSKKVIDAFNTRYFSKQGNRRALGFDKPLFNPRKDGNTAESVTQSSYGHTGFTGTMVWVDPDAELLYIFLSNRVCPSTSPNKLSQLNIRTDIQELLYQIDF